MVQFFAHAAVVGFAAVMSLAHAQPYGYSVRSEIDDRLYRINLATGVAEQLGVTGFGKIEGLALNAAGELFGVNLIPQAPAQTVKCSTTSGVCTSVGSTTQTSGGSAGLAFSPTGQLYLAMNSALFSVNPQTGAATALSASSGPTISGLASGAITAQCGTGIYALAGNSDAGKLYCVNTTTGALTLLGSLPGLTTTTAIDAGLDGDRTTGVLWGITNPSDSNAPAQIFSVAPETLAISALTPVTLSGAPIGGFESLAVEPSSAVSGPTQIPTVSTVGLLAVGLGLCGFAFAALRRREAELRAIRARVVRR
ncbi:MAG: hypothetical protein EAZ43_05505 [Betaproteobacteria bacterium]|nr:MAG: hypothetical protein EAZ43_05505 [Betaproteobacteria bacterium]